MNVKKFESKIFMILMAFGIVAAGIAGCTNKTTSPTAAATATVTRTSTSVTVSSATRTITRTTTPTATTTVSATITPTFTVTMTSTTTTNQLAVVLGSSANFAILSSSAITDVPSSAVTGNVGLYPGLRAAIGITVPEVTGNIYAANDAPPVPADLIQAETDAQNAYLDATSSSRGTPTLISGDQNGITLAPGLYESDTSIEISPAGILYLDGKGDANAVFIIRSANTITTSSTSSVVLEGNAQAKNVFWVAGSAITLGTNSIMKGTMIASTSISILTGANLQGRALLQGPSAAEVTLDTDTIVLP